MSVSTFILTTPKSTAALISSGVDPEPPWKTRSKGREPSGSPSSLITASWAFLRISGRSLTLPGL